MLDRILAAGIGVSAFGRMFQYNDEGRLEYLAPGGSEWEPVGQLDIAFVSRIADKIGQRTLWPLYVSVESLRGKNKRT